MPGRTHCIACGTPLSAPVNDVDSSVPSVTETYPVASEPVIEAVSLSDNPSDAPSSVLSAPLSETALVQENISSSLPAEPPVSDLVPAGVSNILPDIPAPGLDNPLVADDSVAPEVPSWLNDGPSAPISHPDPMVSVQTPGADVPVRGVGESPRVNVQFDEGDVAEVAMPVHSEPEKVDAVKSDANQSGVGEVEPHTGPWLALSVLVGGFILICLLVYFLYKFFFGGSDIGGGGAVVVPTSVVTTTPVVTPTPVATLSVNDAQREIDIADLRIALNAYYQNRQSYPIATNYNSLLNALIGGGYLTRRIQDPAFPGQEYMYTVDSSGSSYEVIVTFDTTASTLLRGASSSVYRMGSN